MFIYDARARVCVCVCVCVCMQVLNATSVHVMRLSLEHNCLEQIPATVNCLSLLTFLNLAHNRYADVC